MLYRLSILTIIFSIVPYLYFFKGKEVFYLFPGVLLSIIFLKGLYSLEVPGKKYVPFLLYSSWTFLAFLIGGNFSISFFLRTAGYFIGGYAAVIIMGKVFNKQHRLESILYILSSISFLGLLLLGLFLLGFRNFGVMVNMRIPYLGIPPIRSVVFGPNYFSIIAFFASALSFYLYCRERRWFLLVVFIVNLSALFLAFSRAGFLAAFVFMSIYLGMKKRMFLLPFLLFSIFIPLIFPSFIQVKKGFTGREVIWPLAVQLIEEKPLLGWGMEVRKVFARTGIKWDSAHNSFLDLAIMYGLVSLVLYIYFMVLSFLNVLRSRGEFREFLLPLFPSIFVLSFFTTMIVGGFSVGSVLSGIFFGMGLRE